MRSPNMVLYELPFAYLGNGTPSHVCASGKKHNALVRRWQNALPDVLQRRHLHPRIRTVNGRLMSPHKAKTEAFLALSLAFPLPSPLKSALKSRTEIFAGFFLFCRFFPVLSGNSTTPTYC